MSGLIILYIGDGKGKTTAAVGLAVRAAGSDKTVLFTQFVKAREARESGEWEPSGEIEVLKKIKNTEVKIYGKGFVGIMGDMKERSEHEKAAREGIKDLKKKIASGKYDVVVADELVTALELKLIELEEVLDLISIARDKIEALAMTGHKRIKKLTEEADLVTEMKMIKHPYYKGVLAKRGIDY